MQKQSAEEVLPDLFISLTSTPAPWQGEELPNSPLLLPVRAKANPCVPAP